MDEVAGTRFNGVSYDCKPHGSQAAYFHALGSWLAAKAGTEDARLKTAKSRHKIGDLAR
jgi:hypothetical protein